MKRRRSCFLLFLILARSACLAGQPAPSSAVPEMTDAEKIYGLSLIWQEVNYNFAYFDQVPELD